MKRNEKVSFTPRHFFMMFSVGMVDEFPGCGGWTFYVCIFLVGLPDGIIALLFNHECLPTLS